MTTKKLFFNPNNSFKENISKLWIAFNNWIGGTEFNFELVDESNCDFNIYGERILNVNWENLYREYKGKSAPFYVCVSGEPDFDEIEEFISLMYYHVILDDKKYVFENKINDYLKRFNIGYLFHKGIFIRSNDIINQPDVKEVLEWVDIYPKVAKEYYSALRKLSDGLYERNTIDDMRLALELLVKEITGVEKTLENQIQLLGLKLKEKNVLPQVRNMIITMLTFYTKYQNDYAKHNDEVNKDDLEIIINMTVNIMKYIKEKLG